MICRLTGLQTSTATSLNNHVCGQKSIILFYTWSAFILPKGFSSKFTRMQNDLLIRFSKSPILFMCTPYWFFCISLELLYGNNIKCMKGLNCKVLLIPNPAQLK